MKEDQEQSDGALVSSSNRALARNSGLVRRGLDDLLNRQSPTDSSDVSLNPTKELARTIPEQAPSSSSNLWEHVRILAEELARGDETNSLGMDLVRIPEGRFMMGSDRRDDEKPIHEVTIKKPFYMCRYRVSQAQWRQIMGVAPAQFTDDNDPVHGVSWDDAHEFINRLNLIDEPVHLLDKRRVQFEYRLPSEAEWEFACRAGLPGDVTGDVYFMDIYGDAPRGHSGLPVGEKRPNAFGLYDMLVGFKEWCEDRYHVNYDNAPSDGSAWGEVAGEENRVPQMNRVARGAFSGSPMDYWRASARSWGAPSSRGIVFGLRLVAVER